MAMNALCWWIGGAGCIGIQVCREPSIAAASRCICWISASRSPVFGMRYRRRPNILRLDSGYLLDSGGDGRVRSRDSPWPLLGVRRTEVNRLRC